jgi:adenosylcobinamide-GDP ribazoletransferase
LNDLRTALGLLTILPLGANGQVSGRAFAFYPFVGALIGTVLVGARILFQLGLPDLVVSALLVLVWVVLTGALHLDGFADSCDALFAATTRERRLEILHDVHLGAFGAASLILLLITKFAAVASLRTCAPLFLAPILGRWAMVYAATYPPARAEGMAVLFRAGLTRRVILAATVVAASLTALCGGFGLVAFVTAFALATLLARFATARVGGLTGDVYGMICECVEVAIMVLGTSVT